jgi:DNA-directed RNA polymerase subunit alpha
MINFKVEQENQTDTEGVFVLEPLQQGFGHTLGSCIRRVLLTSLDGAAITSVKIDGVSHQFATLTGMSEDILELILNLKKVRIKLFSDKPVKMTINFTGKGEVTAKDIDAGGNGEIVNTDLVLAHLNDAKAKLKMEMTVEKGNGYVLADETSASEIGVIPVDAIYSPVLKVEYHVEPTRVGRNTNYDKLTLTITTDGTVKPEDALMQSSRLLSAFFKQVFEPTFDETIVESTPSVSDDVLKLSVEELDLPVRITNALKAIDIDTVEKLTTVSKSQLMKAKNLGGKSLGLITEKLTERGLTLSEA